MEYGEICNNTAQNNGGGIYTKDDDISYEHVNSCGIEWKEIIVYIKNGKVSNNASENDGGGIYTKGTSFFTECGEISNNIANRGGGIYMEHTSFNMEDRKSTRLNWGDS